MRENDGMQLIQRFEQVSLSDEVDEKLGFSRVEGNKTRRVTTDKCDQYVRLVLESHHTLDLGESSRLAIW